MAADSSFKWQQNLACISTYKILAGDDNLDQFEEGDISFDDAPTVKMNELRYYPKTTSNHDIIGIIAVEVARKFARLLIKRYSVKKEDEMNLAEILTKIDDIFVRGDRTIKDLAETVDGLIIFADDLQGTPDD